MTRPINASLFISDFLATGNPGEYIFENAQFNNQADATNNGSGDVAVGFTIFVPATDPNQGSMIPGLLHRYKLTEVSTPNGTGMLSGTMLWAEPGPEQDAPTSNSFCMLAEVTAGHGFSLLPLDTVYAGLSGGMTAAALVLENRDVADAITGGGGGVAPVVYKSYGFTADSAPTVLSPTANMSLQAGATAQFNTTVIGKRTDAPNERCVLNISGSIYMDDDLNTVALIGGTLTTILARTDTSWFAQADANAAVGGIDITVTGSENVSLTWLATTTLTLF